MASGDEERNHARWLLGIPWKINRFELPNAAWRLRCLDARVGFGGGFRRRRDGRVAKRRGKGGFRFP